jgi:hypothetical protein
MKWILIVIALLILVAGFIYLMGALMPIKHQSVVESQLPTTPEILWKALTTHAEYKSWRRGIKELKAVDDYHWSELNAHGDTVNYRADWVEQNRKLLTVILNKDLPYGGQWEFEITKTDAGSHLRITENGEVYNPLFRFMSKYVFGHDATLKAYITDLQARLKSFQ